MVLNDVVDWIVFALIVLTFLLLIVLSIILVVQNDRLRQEIRIKKKIISDKTIQLETERRCRLAAEAQLGRELAGRHRKEL